MAKGAKTKLLEETIKKYRFNASALGYLFMRGRNGAFSETTKRFLVEELANAVYNRKKEFYSHFTEKGIVVEAESIALLSKALNIPLIKNEKKFENEFIKGIPDVIVGNNEFIIDIKSSWDLFTFLNVRELPTQYYLQLQAYMWLTGARRSAIAYVLVDTPGFILRGEATRTIFRKGIQPNTEESENIYEELEKKHTYKDIPEEERVKIFIVEYDKNTVENIKQVVEDGRRFMVDYLNAHRTNQKNSLAELRKAIKSIMLNKINT